MSFIPVSTIYHTSPDKHPNSTQNPHDKFQKIVLAYETLVDPNKRYLYDLYGDQSLDIQFDNVVSKHDAVLLYETRERMRMDDELLRELVSTNHTTCSINASSLFLENSLFDQDHTVDHESDAGVDPSTPTTAPLGLITRMSDIQITLLTIKQSIQANVTNSITLLASGTASASKGKGNGILSLGFKHAYTHSLYGIYHVEFGNSKNMVGGKIVKEFSDG